MSETNLPDDDTNYVIVPDSVKDELDDYGYVDNEVSGALMGVQDEDTDDFYVATWVPIAAGTPTNTKTPENSQQMKYQWNKLEDFREHPESQENNFNYIPFHTHTVGGLLETGKRPDGFSPQDIQGEQEMAEQVGKDNYFGVLVYPDEQLSGESRMITSSDDYEVGYVPDTTARGQPGWTDDNGNGIQDVEEQIDQIWEEIGGQIPQVQDQVEHINPETL